MSAVAQVTIHESQFPEGVRLELLDSLRSGRINSKFHYDSLKQTQKWLALHRAYSPSRTDPECATIYRSAFAAAVERSHSASVHVIGLGCGGGQKDSALLQLLRDSGRSTYYTPCDVSVAMVLVARAAALKVVPEANCFPLVCDLATAQGLSEAFCRTPRRTRDEESASPQEREGSRIFSFLGMIPNFEPEIILPKLAQLVQREDYLLLSANLAPGNDYAAGVEKILPLYNNEPTRDWLMTFLLDLGIESSDGNLRFVIEEQPDELRLRRIAAYFHFTRARAIEVHSERFEFKAGSSIRLFFSYRHTPELVRRMLGQYGLEVLAQWVTASEEEGVFLVRRRA